jgi:hypothetical protein
MFLNMYVGYTVFGFRPMFPHTETLMLKMIDDLLYYELCEWLSSEIVERNKFRGND